MCSSSHMCVSVWGWPKGRSPNSCVLVPASRHLVHSTCNAGTQGGEWCPSLPLKSSVHPSIPSHCPWGSRRPQLNTDLPERAQVQQGVCPTAKCCACVSFGLMGGLCSSLFCFWGDLKKLQMQVFDQPVNTTRNMGESETYIKKTEAMKQSKRTNLIGNLQDCNK